MRVNLAPGWKTDLDRGPDWLFVRIYGPDSEDADAKGLAENVRAMLQQELKSRLLLELDQVAEVPGDFAEELVRLCDDLERDGTVFRLCGLAATHHRFLRERHFEHRHFRDRNAALTDSREAVKPRLSSTAALPEGPWRQASLPGGTSREAPERGCDRPPFPAFWRSRLLRREAFVPASGHAPGQRRFRSGQRSQPS